MESRQKSVILTEEDLLPREKGKCVVDLSPSDFTDEAYKKIRTANHVVFVRGIFAVILKNRSGPHTSMEARQIIDALSQDITQPKSRSQLRPLPTSP